MPMHANVDPRMQERLSTGNQSLSLADEAFRRHKDRRGGTHHHASRHFRLAMIEAGRDQARPAPLSGAALIVIGLVLSLSTFTVVLDLTVANVSVPHIASGLAASTTQ